MARRLEVYSFEKGEYTDVNPEQQPKGSYRKAVNFIRDDKGQLITEKGTTSINTLPSGLEIVGDYNLNGEIILFLANSIGTISEIGILAKDNTYSVVITNRSDPGIGATLQLSSNLLGFSFSSRLDVEGRILFNGNRVIYFVDGLNNNRRINLDDLPNEERFVEEISLQFDFLIPKVEITSVTSTGALPTGIYQLGARYLTSGGNSTPIGIISNPVPIIDESQNVGRNQADGAPPQTSSSKAINVSLSNVDSNFPFIEIVALTYQGVANTLTINVVGRIENTGGVITFSYSDVNQQLGSLIEEDVTVQPIVYGPGKHIEQKDGILFISNLASDLTDVDLQSLANRVTLEYFIEEVNYEEVINVTVDGVAWNATGKDAVNIAFNYGQTILDVGARTNSFEDYKSELVAGTKVSYMRGEVYSFALVPQTTKGTRGFGYHIPGNSTSDTPANTTSQALGTYVSTEEYPTGRGYPSGNVRHHRMPTTVQEPIFRVSGGQVLVRLLGVRIEIPFLTEAEREALQGITIVRQRRNTVQNRSFIAQGIAKQMFQFSDYITSIPSYGKITLGGNGTDKDDNNIDPNVFSFSSPDIMHGVIDNFTSFDSIQRVGKFTGTRKWDSRGRVQDNGALNLITFNGILSDSTEQPLIDLIQDSRQIEAFTAKADPTTINSNVTEFFGFNLPFGDIPSYRMRASSGALLLATASDNTLPTLFLREEHYFTRSGSEPENYDAEVEVATIELLALRNNIANQYGRVEEARYQFCATIILGTDIPADPSNATFNFYGGDTYINKYALLFNENSAADIRNVETKSIVYFFLESLGNYNYRHFVDEEITGDTIQTGSLPYYPKYNIIQSPDTPIGLIDYTANLGNSLGYNKQYSFENTIIDFIPRPLLFQQQDDFTNRTIHSEETIEGEIADNYRVFLPNSFQDTPKDKGEITNTFVWNNQFMVHTRRGLFQTYVNTREQILTDISQIVVGSGGVFTQPPTELFDIDGGYLGTTSKFCGIVTPFAYYFIANTRGKVFALSDTVTEISDLGKHDFFRETIEDLDESILTETGYVAGFDYENKRFMLTKLGANGFTYSFYTKLQSWTGSHLFQPTLYISRDKDFIVYKSGILYTLNTGLTSSYFGEAESTPELQLALNNPPVNKVFDNLHIGARVRGINKHPYASFFNVIQAYTIDQNSGELSLAFFNDIYTLHGANFIKTSYKGREYRLAFPLDAVIDATGDIFDVANLNIFKEFKGRLNGEYAILTLKKTDLNFATEADGISIAIDYIKLLYRDHRI